MPEPMFHALSRFGLPDAFIAMVKGIYNSRSFFVHDSSNSSSCRPQYAGISQGCPLSPVLFVMVMSILIADARDELHGKIGDLADDVSEILYADDTLIVDKNGNLADTYMQCIRNQGKVYGLDFNWDKLMYISINCNPSICKPNGEPVKHVHSMLYLGALLSDDGFVASELGRRIGLAHSDFFTLSRIWSHANMPVKKKLTIFNAFVLSKLMYALDCVWLSKTELNRIDAFHCMCIRRILKISHSFYSRVSNHDVLQQAKSIPLSLTLMKRQLKLFGRIAGTTDDHILRELVFEPGSFEKPTPTSRLRRGRPRACWVNELHHAARRVCPASDHLNDLLHQCQTSLKPWMKAVDSYLAASNLD